VPDRETKEILQTLGQVSQDMKILILRREPAGAQFFGGKG